MRLLFAAGLGDFLQAESYYSPEKIASITAIVWDTPSRTLYEEFVRSSNLWSHVEHESYPAPYDETVFTYQDVFHLMPFYGSSFFKCRLPSTKKFSLPKRFAVVQSGTPFNDKGVQNQRNITVEEWPAILEWLDEKGLQGVVTNAVGGVVTPQDPRLLDLTGQTSLIESVAILKGSSGYIGIDSWQAIMATQVASNNVCKVRTPNPYVVARTKSFYHFVPELTPHFLKPNYELEPIKEIDGMTIRLKVEHLYEGRVHSAGSLIQVDVSTGKRLVEAGHADEVTDFPTVEDRKAVETAMLKKEREKAVKSRNVKTR